MRNSTLLCRRDLLWIALQARHLNENLENNLQLEFFPCPPCVPWIKKDRWELCDIKGRDDENENL